MWHSKEIYKKAFKEYLKKVKCHTKVQYVSKLINKQQEIQH